MSDINDYYDDYDYYNDISETEYLDILQSFGDGFSSDQVLDDSDIDSFVDIARAMVESIENETGKANNLELLTLGLKLSENLGDYDKSTVFYKKLLKVEKKYWSPLCYIRVGEYLLSHDARSNSKDIEDLCRIFSETFPDDENVTLIRYRLACCLGNHQEGIELLEERIESFQNAAQTAKLLAEYYLNKACPEATIKMVHYAFAASAKTEASKSNAAELIFLETLANDMLFCRKIETEDMYSLDTGEKLLQIYKELLLEKDLVQQYDMIRDRMKIITYLIK